MVMLAWTDGHQRTAIEYEDMLRDIGFVDARVDPAFGYWSIVSARVSPDERLNALNKCDDAIVRSWPASIDCDGGRFCRN